MTLLPGLYELLIDRRLKRLLEELSREQLGCETRPVDPGESHDILSQHLGKVLARVLASMPREDALERQLELCNSIIRLLVDHDRRLTDAALTEAELEGGRQLLSIFQRNAIVGERAVERPLTPLASSSLFTGAATDPDLGSQLRKELLSADRVDILCSFIRWSGIRILQRELEQFSELGRPLRVITTSYMGATEPAAVEYLRQLDRCEVRISYDKERTRLHAKAYLFHRESGFGTAYIGSANISNPALSDGLEWTMKVSQYESAHLWEKIQATFESYWQDRRDFVRYADGDQERLTQSLLAERRGDYGDTLYPFDLRPYEFQEKILEKLQAERQIHCRYRNLVVAATGTGKTVISAFDYQRFRDAERLLSGSGPVKLLYVAHREEILKQARRQFRGVLGDANFGDLWVGNERPDQTEHLFASIQTIQSRKIWESLPASYYDYIVVDEVHHAPASSYRQFLQHFQPKVLLGLTATPERADGEEILSFFDGRIAAEIRLPEAINRRLLAPFQYFGITDTVDLTNVEWKRGGYDPSRLEELYVGNQIRSAGIIKAVQERLLDVKQARGLGFCVSIRHAEYMAETFRQSGIPAEALSGQSRDEQRRTVQERLRSREINFIFSVDLYNEGVDIPEVDTVLLLRPTESLTVFLQQLGRGLRAHRDKEYLTVLDFIGQAHRNFRFDQRFSALLGASVRTMASEVEQGFPHVPLGCSIVLERFAQEYVLQNISNAIGDTRDRLVQRIRELRDHVGHPPALHEFLDHYQMEPEDLYRRGSWTSLLAKALGHSQNEPDEAALTKGLRRVSLWDSPTNLRDSLKLLEALPWQTSADGPEHERLLLMIHFTLWGRTSSTDSIADSFARVRQNPGHYSELVQLLQYCLNRADHLSYPSGLPFPCPLEVHASYSRDQILAGLGEWTINRQTEMREGVLSLKNHPADVFFITLNKTERDYSPTTLYQDYAINEELFHWQSQSTTSAASPTGRRYVEHRERGREVLLFVRENNELPGHLRAPYVFLGAADYVSHTGSRPMSIIWRLRRPLPAWMASTAVKMLAA